MIEAPIIYFRKNRFSKHFSVALRRVSSTEFVWPAQAEKESQSRLSDATAKAEVKENILSC